MGTASSVLLNKYPNAPLRWMGFLNIHSLLLLRKIPRGLLPSKILVLHIFFISLDISKNCTCQREKPEHPQMTNRRSEVHAMSYLTKKQNKTKQKQENKMGSIISLSCIYPLLFFLAIQLKLIIKNVMVTGVVFCSWTA